MEPGSQAEPGLCARCVAARRILTPRSVFWLCARSREEPRFERYPRLPVRACPGFEPLADGAVPPAQPPGPEPGSPR